MDKPRMLVIAHTNLGTSLSGGDRIFINLIKYWGKKYQITAVVSSEAQQLLKKSQLKPITIVTTVAKPGIALNTFNLTRHHFSRFISGLKFAMTHPKLFKNSTHVYTSSDFYGDFIFGIVAKIYNPKIIWICGYYLFSPSPLNVNSPYRVNHQFFRGLIYYLGQLPTKVLASVLANHIFVTSAPDQDFFGSKAHIVQGGVYIPPQRQLAHMLPPSKRQYDAIYIGRLHSQKGVVELIDIWHQVVSVKPKAKLVIIGDGELLPQIIKKINQHHLDQNIILAGFMLGPQKFKLIQQSKIVVHPATYDSGGMAAAEAMAWGLPGVSYDLPALKTYYPKGMLKVPPFNQTEFSQAIINLISKPSEYQLLSRAARKLILSHWGWSKRFSDLYDTINERR